VVKPVHQLLGKQAICYGTKPESCLDRSNGREGAADEEHELPRTTKLYDRAQDAMSLDEVEKWLFQRREIEVLFNPVNPLFECLGVNLSNGMEDPYKLLVGLLLFGVEYLYLELKSFLPFL
jgi:hypothetical protein